MRATDPARAADRRRAPHDGSATPSTVLTTCLGTRDRRCHELVPRGRCSSCQLIHDQERRPDFRARYGPDHERRRRAAIAAEPWCHNPAGCPHADAGTPANPLTLQHDIPIVAGGRDGPTSVWCKRCNSAQGARPLTAGGE